MNDPVFTTPNLHHPNAPMLFDQRHPVTYWKLPEYHGELRVYHVGAREDIDLFQVEFTSGPVMEREWCYVGPRSSVMSQMALFLRVCAINTANVEAAS